MKENIKLRQVAILPREGLTLAKLASREGLTLSNLFCDIVNIMPRKNTKRLFVLDGIYHVYNRGVEKRNIFLEESDYLRFLNILKEALKKEIPTAMIGPHIKDPVQNFSDTITMLAYCLMPNHFHFLIQQQDEHSLHTFLKSVCTRYSMYFNKKYRRIGALFESVYKAILIDDDAYFLHISRYIHRNPIKLGVDLVTAHSSYAQYLGLKNISWVNPHIILSSFSSNIPSQQTFTSYKSFVEDTDEAQKKVEWTMDAYLLDNEE